MTTGIFSDKKFRVALDVASANQPPEWSITGENATHVARLLDRAIDGAPISHTSYPRLGRGFRGFIITDISEADGSAPVVGKRWCISKSGEVFSETTAHRNLSVAQELVERLLKCAPAIVSEFTTQDEIMRHIRYAQNV